MRFPSHTHLAMAIWYNNEVKIRLQCVLSGLKRRLKDKQIDIYSYKHFRWTILECLKSCRKERKKIYSADKEWKF